MNEPVSSTQLLSKVSAANFHVQETMYLNLLHIRRLEDIKCPFETKHIGKYIPSKLTNQVRSDTDVSFELQ